MGAARPGRACLGCGRVIPGGSRCGECQRDHNRRRDHRRGTRSQRGYGVAYTVRRALILRSHPFCAYCGAPAGTVDHVVPLARGGTNSLDNLVACCAECNASKGARDGWQPGTPPGAGSGSSSPPASQGPTSPDAHGSNGVWPRSREW